MRPADERLHAEHLVIAHRDDGLVNDEQLAAADRVTKVTLELRPVR